MKKLVSKIMALLFSIMLCFSLLGCGLGGNSENPGDGDGGDKPLPDPPIEETVTYDTYGSYWMSQHDYKTMPIAAYNSCPQKLPDFTHNYLESEQTFKDYADAGVNIMMGLTEYAGSYNRQILQALDWCDEYGLSYLLAYAGADSVKNDSGPKSALSQIKFRDAFGGIMLSDEPGKVMFDDITAAEKIFQSVMPQDMGDKLMYTNLFPTYASSKQLYYRIPTGEAVPGGSYTYEQYLDDFLSTFKPKVLSYDNYPLLDEFPSLRSDYFTNMSIIREKALQENIPFWVFNQTASFAENVRIPTAAELKWLVNTSLSYGSKGIQYFTGVLPTNAYGGEQFAGAMFDRAGNKTSVYDYVKQADKQIAAVDEVLMCSKSKGVMQAGSTPVTIPSKDKLTSFQELSTVSGNHSLVGCFDYKGSTALYITNNSLSESDTANLTFSKPISGYTIIDGVKKEFTGTSLEVELSAGNGALVVLSNKFTMSSAISVLNGGQSDRSEKLNAGIRPNFSDGFEDYNVSGEYIENDADIKKAWINNIMLGGEPVGMDVHSKNIAKVKCESGTAGNKVLHLKNTSGADTFFYMGVGNDFRVKNFKAGFKLKFLTADVKERSWVGLSLRKRANIHYTGTNNLMLTLQRYAEAAVTSSHAYGVFIGGEPIDLKQNSTMFGDKLNIKSEGYALPDTSAREDSKWLDVRYEVSGNTYKMYVNDTLTLDMTFDVNDFDYYGYLSLNCCGANILVDDFYTDVLDTEAPPVILPLSTPIPVLDEANNKITWTAIDGVYTYDVRVNGKSNIVITNSFNLQQIKEAGDYTITITAISDDQFEFKDSEPSEAINYTVAAIKKSDGCGSKNLAAILSSVGLLLIVAVLKMKK